MRRIHALGYHPTPEPRPADDPEAELYPPVLLKADKTLLRRRGICRVSMEFVENYPDTVQQLMADIIVLNAEYYPTTRLFEYTFVSMSLPIVGEGEMSRPYDLMIETTERGSFLWHNFKGYSPATFMPSKGI